jgi:hypothetical protein
MMISRPKNNLEITKEVINSQSELTSIVASLSLVEDVSKLKNPSLNRDLNALLHSGSISDINHNFALFRSELVRLWANSDALASFDQNLLNTVKDNLTLL